MANPVAFTGCNFTFLAPKGQEETMRDLHVHKDAGGTTSCWRLTEDEMKEVAKSGVVWLRIFSHSMAPVYISGASFQFADGRHAVADPYIPLKNQTEGKR